jgi:tripartite-type tricarboxylate transporter receptor subunit TctC
MGEADSKHKDYYRLMQLRSSVFIKRRFKRRSPVDRVLLAVVMAVFGATYGQAAPAESYPSRPIRLIVGFPIGGAIDVIARILGQKLSERFGHQIVIDNRSGAGGVMAAEITRNAAADGYTLLMVSSSHVTSAAFRKLPYDPVADFAAVSLTAIGSNVLVANPMLPVQSVAELVKLARLKPGQINFASGGTGSITHLSGELLRFMARIELTHVPYKGAAPALIDVVSGQMHLLFSSVPAALPQIKAGRVRALGVTLMERSKALPDVPTIAESGVPGYEAANWSVLLAPALTARPIIAKLNSEILSALKSPEVADALVKQGVEPKGTGAKECQAYLKSETEKWARVVKNAGIQPE